MLANKSDTFGDRFVTRRGDLTNQRFVIPFTRGDGVTSGYKSITFGVRFVRGWSCLRPRRGDLTNRRFVSEASPNKSFASLTNL